MSIDFEPVEPTYLGDSVYASFDGYHIWLGLGDHRSRLIALEPEVLLALFNYHNLVSKKVREHHEAVAKSLADDDGGI